MTTPLRGWHSVSNALHTPSSPGPQPRASGRRHPGWGGMTADARLDGASGRSAGAGTGWMRVRAHGDNIEGTHCYTASFCRECEVGR